VSSKEAIAVKIKAVITKAVIAKTANVTALTIPHLPSVVLLLL
jgi:hypothetical protein